MRGSITAFCLLTLLSLPAAADVVELVDGSFVEGTIAAEGKDFVAIVPPGRERRSARNGNR